MNDKTQNGIKTRTHFEDSGRTFFAAMPSTGEYVGIRDGWAGYSETTIYDLGHCSVMNARAGNTPGEVEAALHCSIMGNWDGFTAMAMALDTKGQEKGLALHKLEPGDQVYLHNTTDQIARLDTSGGGRVVFQAQQSLQVTIKSFDDGLIMVGLDGFRYVGCFSYMNGKGCGVAQAFSIRRAAADDPEVENHPQGQLKREGIDHDPVKPWNWATMPGKAEPVEILSMPTPEGTVMVRMTVGDPTTLKEVPLTQIAAFSPSRHEDYTTADK